MPKQTKVLYSCGVDGWTYSGYNLSKDTFTSKYFPTRYDVTSLGSLINVHDGRGECYFNTSSIKNAISAKLVFKQVVSIRTKQQYATVMSSSNSCSCSELDWGYNSGTSSGEYSCELSANEINRLNQVYNLTLYLSNSLVAKRTYTGGTGHDITNGSGLNPSYEAGVAKISSAFANDLNAHYIEYSVLVPQGSNISLNNKDVSQAITVSFTLTDVQSWTLQAIQNGVVVAQKTGTTATSCKFNAKELPPGDVTFKLITVYGDETSVATSDETLTAPQPSISSVQLNNTDISKSITLTASKTNVDSWQVQVFQNNKAVATKTGSGNINVTFNTGEIKAVGDTIFRVTGYNYWYDKSEDKSVDLTAPCPSISNITLSGTNVDNAITVTASSSNTDRWVIEEIQGNTVKCTKSGTGNIRAIFNIGETFEGETTFRITGYNTWNSDHEDKTVTLKAPQASATNIAITGTSIDGNITVAASGTNVYNWRVDAIQNGTVKARKTGTGNTISATFQAGEIKQTGQTEFKITYSNTWNGSNISQIATLTRIEPIIIGLEPNGVTANRDLIIVASWATQNQQTFSLNCDGHVYSGTTATTINIPANTLQGLGTKYMALTIKYTSSWGETRQASKTVAFTAVGKPRTPVLIDHEFYDKAKPTFHFSSPDTYTQFNLVILDEDNAVVIDSVNVTDTSGEYTLESALSNNTTYKVKLRIKTPYGYWSDFDISQFTTDFVMANKPSISLYVSDRSIIINSFTKYSVPLDYCDIYRRTEYGEWVRIAHKLDNDISFKDDYVGDKVYYYKVSSVATSGGINDSDILKATVEIKNFNFADIMDLKNNIEFIGNPEVELTDVFESSSNEYAGVKSPIFESGEHNYVIGKCSFTCEKSLYDKFKAMISKADVLMYRDCRGEKIFCKIYGNIPRPKFHTGWVTISFEFVEVPFIEKDIFIGYGNVASIFWDGKYTFDGTVYWDGDTIPETQNYSGIGNQTLVFKNGAYQWEEKAND